LNGVVRTGSARHYPRSRKIPRWSCRRPEWSLQHI